MTSIPIFSVLVRYNLVNEGWASPLVANIIGVGAPWAASLFFYAGNQLSELMNWSSAVCFALINLAIPLTLYLRQRVAMATADGASPGGAAAKLAAAMAEDADEAAAAAAAARAGYLDVDGDGAGPLLLSDFAGASSAINAAWGSDDLRVVAAGTSPDAAAAEDIRPTPACCRRRIIGDTRLALALLAASLVAAAAGFALQCYQEVENDTGGGGGGGGGSR
jgi:hypothetical protein